jgi:hypothetical protein
VKSYLLSTLRLEFGGRRLEDFVATAPHAWLLWAPGEWRPPVRQTAPLPLAEAVQGPAGPEPELEALAIELPPLTRPVVLGRAGDCDVIINDGRLSARHLGLHFDGTGWAAEDLRSTNGTRVDGRALGPGELERLRDGATIDAAQIVLEFLTSEGLWPRLAAG